MSHKNVLLISEDANKRQPLETYLSKQRYVVTALLESDINIMQALVSKDYSVVVFSLNALKQDHIKAIQYIQQTAAKPVIIFADQCDDNWIMKAVNTGANSIVVDGIKEHRIKKVLDIAAARFQQCMRLRTELNQTRKKLEERRDIDRAKGILMKKKQLDEQQAYSTLRKLAMDNNQRIGEVARTLILATELLD